VTLEGARRRFGARIGDEELLLRLTMPAEQVDAIQTLPAERPRTRPSPPSTASQAPIVRLLHELERRPGIAYVRVEDDEDLVVWRRRAR